ncbi:TPA: hypothetical protein I7764_21140 [Vibrio vulnificus]|nr:hypothetical protein [Vibrio vulnificus]
MKKLYLALVTVLFALLGCGGEGSGSSSSNNNGSVEQEPVVYTQDGIVRTYTEQKLSVDLSERNSISNSEALLIDDITNITGSSQCDPVTVSGMTFELGAFENPTMCQYQYSLRSVESGTTFSNPRMVTNVLVEQRTTIMPNSRASLRSLPSTTLPPIQLSVSVPGSVVNIDLNAQLASLYPKDSEGNNYVLSNTILVLGSGSAKATTDDLKSSIVEYTSDAYDLGGITRLIYSLSDDFDGNGVGDFKVGAIDISVSASGSNSNPETKYFQWTNNGTDIQVGQKYTIDVASDISAECTYGREPQDTKGSCIYDADSDSLQIVGVYAYDATVAPTSLTQLDNTKFDVTFSRTGTHDITYQVSDHFGGFATGIVRVYVKENSAPVLQSNPYILYANENTGMSINASDLATDIDGDTVTFKSLIQPTSGKVKAEISTDKSKIQVDVQVDSEGTHFFDVVLTDGKAEVTQHWVVIVNSNTHLSLKSELERTFSVNVNTPITIDISSLIEGYRTGEQASVEVKSTSGALLGTVKVSDTNKSKVVYTPNSNAIGVDDFIFEVKTNSGAEIAGNVIVHVGNPPALAIAAIDATEGQNDLITASVTCEYCDVSKYEYEWVINGETVSREKSFTITPEQRIYNVTLLVIGYDVFGQVTYELGSFDFFKVVIGSFEQPAKDCQDIFLTYNSPYALKANDGEYWLRSADNTYTYKTQCDMVSQPEADESNKIVGGYTLIWSYSEKTNLERFGGNTQVFSQLFKNVDFAYSTLTSSTLANGRGLVTSENGGNVDYNNFRVTNNELLAKFNTSHARVNYTSDISTDSIDEDEDGVVQNWHMNTQSPVNFFGTDVTLAGTKIKGRFNNIDVSGDSVGQRVLNLTAYAENETQNRNITLYYGSTSWGFHFDTFMKIGDYVIDNMWGYFGQDSHQAADLFGLCTSPTYVTIHGIRALACNADIAGAKTYHQNINNGEGYVLQWWAQ